MQLKQRKFTARHKPLNFHFLRLKSFSDVSSGISLADADGAALVSRPSASASNMVLVGTVMWSSATNAHVTRARKTEPRQMGKGLIADCDSQSMTSRTGMTLDAKAALKARRSRASRQHQYLAAAGTSYASDFCCFARRRKEFGGLLQADRLALVSSAKTKNKRLDNQVVGLFFEIVVPMSQRCDQPAHLRHRNAKLETMQLPPY